jgi:hypothetical protein
MLIGHLREGHLQESQTFNLLEAIAFWRRTGVAPAAPALPLLPFPVCDTLQKFVSEIRQRRIPTRLLQCISQAGGHDRTIVEFCCEDTSIIGMVTAASSGCRTIRITESVDGCSCDGMYLASKGCIAGNTLLFASIPCTGGSPWQHINKETTEGRTRIRAHIRLMQRLFRAFEQLCYIAIACGCYIAIEWPDGCSYWRRKDVRRLISICNLKPVCFHGCALGVVSRRPVTLGMPIKKPWRILTNCESILDTFHDKTCPGCAAHAPCRGTDAKATGEYSPEFARLLHTAFRSAVTK